jgi:hypothetical protein
MRKWTVRDRYGNTIYLTQERWEHITHPANHPDMEGYCDHLKTTIQKGRRRQEALDPRKYRYIHFFDDLVGDNNCIVAVVRFKFDVDENGNIVENNFVLTAYQKSIKRKR